MRKTSENKKFKKGIASFYIVAISTLILVVVASSFAGVIISEVTRTSNDDLAQSAYDSALAGVEDAKLAFSNYQECKHDSTKEVTPEMTCEALIAAIEGTVGGNGEDNCDLVANALGRRIEVDGDGKKIGVLIAEDNSEDGDNNMKQYYTCVKIAAKTEDYLGTLNQEDPEHAVRLKFAVPTGQSEQQVMDSVAKVRLSWHSFDDNADSKDKEHSSFSWMTPGEEGMTLLGTNKVTPAVVALTMVQTAPQFQLSEFDASQNGQTTDRGTLYFVPYDVMGDNKPTAAGENYNLVMPEPEDSGSGVIRDADTGTNAFVKANDKNVKNKPYLVPCTSDQTQDYACSVTVDIPKPVNSNSRNSDTFIFSVALPYGGPKTDYRLEFLDENDHTLVLNGVQVSIDSTGRANDLFRRVDMRMEPADVAFPYPIYTIENLDPNVEEDAIQKAFDTTCEYDFADQPCQ